MKPRHAPAADESATRGVSPPGAAPLTSPSTGIEHRKEKRKRTDDYTKEGRGELGRPRRVARPVAGKGLVVGRRVVGRRRRGGLQLHARDVQDLVDAELGVRRLQFMQPRPHLLALHYAMI